MFPLRVRLPDPGYRQRPVVLGPRPEATGPAHQTSAWLPTEEPTVDGGQNCHLALRSWCSRAAHPWNQYPPMKPPSEVVEEEELLASEVRWEVGQPTRFS